MNDEDETIATRAERDDTVWPETPIDPNRKPVVKPLPTSSHPMWDGAHMQQVGMDELERQRKLMYDTMKDHKPLMRGQEFVCTSCPFEHTLGIDPTKFTIDHTGTVIPIDKASRNSVS